MKKLKQHMYNEKGFTLIEILVVIAIIAILFVTLLPQIDNAVNRSRETGVKTDFHTMQTAMETYMRETGGNKINAEVLNKYLDPGMQISIKNPAGDGLTSAKLDPWGKPYDVYFFKDNKAIVFKTFGPNETVAALGTDSDDYIIATYYYNGQVTTCTSGFDTNNVESTHITGTKKCGFNLPGSATTLTSGTAMKTIK